VVAYGCFSFGTGVAWGLIPALYSGASGQQFLPWLMAFGLAGMVVGFLVLPFLGGDSRWRLLILGVPVCFIALLVLGGLAAVGHGFGIFSTPTAALPWLGLYCILVGMLCFPPTYLLFLLTALNLHGCRVMARRLGLQCAGSGSLH
jgi:hypothetical protein